MATIKGSVQHTGSLSTVFTLEIAGLPEDTRLHVDDGTDGTFAGNDPGCNGCGNRVGYLHCDVPATMEEAYAAAFIPCVEFDATNNLYCLTCVLDGTAEEQEEEEN